MENMSNPAEKVSALDFSSFAEELCSSFAITVKTLLQKQEEKFDGKLERFRAQLLQDLKVSGDEIKNDKEKQVECGPESPSSQTQQVESVNKSTESTDPDPPHALSTAEVENRSLDQECLAPVSPDVCNGSQLINIDVPVLPSPNICTDPVPILAERITEESASTTAAIPNSEGEISEENCVDNTSGMDKDLNSSDLTDTVDGQSASGSESDSETVISDFDGTSPPVQSNVVQSSKSDTTNSAETVSLSAIANRPEYKCVVSMKQIPQVVLDLFDDGQAVTIDQYLSFLPIFDKDFAADMDQDYDSDTCLDGFIRRVSGYDGILKPRQARADEPSSTIKDPGVKATKIKEVVDPWTESDGTSDSDTDSSKDIGIKPAVLRRVVSSSDSDESQLDTRPTKISMSNSESEEDSDSRSHVSDSEYLSAGSVSVSKDKERAAKRAALKVSKSEAQSSSEHESSSDGSTSEQEQPPTKTKGPSYYTPNMCRIGSESDFEEATKKQPVRRAFRRFAEGKNVSESDDSDFKSWGRAKRKRASSSEESSLSLENGASKNSSTKSSSDEESSFSSRDESNSRQLENSPINPNSSSSQVTDIALNRTSETAASSSSEEEDDEQKQRGRKNIREILDKRALMRETREAGDREEERIRRLAVKQKEYNKIFKSQEPSSEILDVILDFDEEKKEPLVTVDRTMVKHLKPHQAEGINFMWNACFESIKQYNNPSNQGVGCILAHCMGLGKTLQSVAFVHSVLTSPLLKVKTVLIVCPLNTVHNWAKEFKMWLKEAPARPKVYKLYESGSREERIQDLEQWHSSGNGIGIINYNRFRDMVKENQTAGSKGGEYSKSERRQIDKCLLDPGPDLIICDEGHTIKNEKSKIFISLNRVATKRRIVLTGTPMQNNLLEYHTMMSFVKPYLLGAKDEFMNQFVNPITNGQHQDSTAEDVMKMKKRIHVLHKLLDGTVQRMDHTILDPFLQPKYDYALVINMTDIQKKLYNGYLERIGGRGVVKARIKLRYFLEDFSVLSKIWSHPTNLTLPTTNRKNKRPNNVMESEGEEEDGAKIGPEIDEAESNPSTAMDCSNMDGSGMQPKSFKKRESEKWWEEHFEDPGSIADMEHSSKLTILREILITCAEIGDKVLIFSQYIYSLKLIEKFLNQMDEEERLKATSSENQSNERRWRFGKEYYRIYGSVRSSDRQKYCEEFNLPHSKAKLFLVSTKAGGVGINLVGANRVILFDASFNPANDMQAIYRVFRFGQEKPCYIYRLLAKGTMEEKIYNRQVVKLSLSGRVVDEKQIERHFGVENLSKMYRPVSEVFEPRPLLKVPEDKLLADVLLSDTFKDLLHSYVEHDSLLEHKSEEVLDDDELNLAWKEYESGRHVSKEDQTDATADLSTTGSLDEPQSPNTDRATGGKSLHLNQGPAKINNGIKRPSDSLDHPKKTSKAVADDNAEREAGNAAKPSVASGTEATQGKSKTQPAIPATTVTKPAIQTSAATSEAKLKSYLTSWEIARNGGWLMVKSHLSSKGIGIIPNSQPADSTSTTTAKAEMKSSSAQSVIKLNPLASSKTATSVNSPKAITLGATEKKLPDLSPGAVLLSSPSKPNIPEAASSGAPTAASNTRPVKKRIKRSTSTGPSGTAGRPYLNLRSGRRPIVRVRRSKRKAVLLRKKTNKSNAYRATLKRILKPKIAKHTC